MPLEQLDLLVLQVQLETEVHLEIKAHLETLAPLDPKARQVLKVRGELLD